MNDVVTTESRALVPVASEIRIGRLPAISNRLIQSMAVRAVDAGLEGKSAVGLAAVFHGEGTTTVACSIANCASSVLGQRVVLIDANARSPALRQVFGLGPGPGLADVLSGANSLESALFHPNTGPAAGGGLLVMPASSTGQDSPSALRGPAMTQLIGGLRAYADLILFDAPPLRDYPDAVMLARNLDGMLLVLRAEHTGWDDSRAAVQDLRDSGAHVLGAVLNRRKSYIPRLLDRLL